MGTRGDAGSVRALARKRQTRRGSAKAEALRPIPTSHRVNHDVLMGRLAKRIADKRVLGLIRRYLEAGIMANGVAMERYEGTPQGGPLSPLLANALLDEVDRELEKRGLGFARYADDLNVYTGSRRAADDAMVTLKRLYTAYRELPARGVPERVARAAAAHARRWWATAAHGGLQTALP